MTTSELQIITNGTVILHASEQIANTTNFTLDNSALLDLQTFATSETIANLSGSGTVDLGPGSVLTAGSAGNSTFSGVITGPGGLTKAAAGTLTLTGVNTFTGTMTVTGGTLLLGADDTLSTSASPGSTREVTLSGGTLRADGFSQGAATGERLGTLTLTGNSTIQFTLGDSVQDLFFDDYDRTGGLLTISNWQGFGGGSGTGGGLFFSTSANFTASELAQISFTGFSQGAQLLAFNGNFNELTPVPEPSAVMSAVGMLGLIGWRERHRKISSGRKSRTEGPRDRSLAGL